MQKSNAVFFQRMNAQLGIIGNMGRNITTKSVLLDLGCGKGNLVREYRINGYDAYGCDFDFPHDPLDASLKAEGVLRKISLEEGYKLPFADNSFDFVFSDQVFEHVMDYETTLAEIKRVLKLDGVSLHFFPSRYKLMEVHVKVPFASIVRKKPWLQLWASLGVKNNFQKGLSAKEVADSNHHFLTTQTRYLTKKQIKNYCKKYFREVRFCEANFLHYVKQGRILSHLFKVLPFLPFLYSAMHSRVLFFGDKLQNQAKALS